MDMTGTSPQALAPPPVRAQTAYKFLSELQLLEQMIDGLPIGRGRLIAITGPTGHGKTTIATALQVAFAWGDFHSRGVRSHSGRVAGVHSARTPKTGRCICWRRCRSTGSSLNTARACS